MKEHQNIFPSAARTATSSKTTSIKSCQGLIFINVTTYTAGASLVFSILGVAPGINSPTYSILESAAITAAGLTVLRISPQLTAAANTIAKDILPAGIKVTATHADNKTCTYTVDFVGVD